MSIDINPITSVDITESKYIYVHIYVLYYSPTRGIWCDCSFIDALSAYGADMYYKSTESNKKQVHRGYTI